MPSKDVRYLLPISTPVEHAKFVVNLSLILPGAPPCAAGVCWGCTGWFLPFPMTDDCFHHVAERYHFAENKKPASSSLVHPRLKTGHHGCAHCLEEPSDVTVPFSSHDHDIVMMTAQTAQGERQRETERDRARLVCDGCGEWAVQPACCWKMEDPSWSECCCLLQQTRSKPPSRCVASVLRRHMEAHQAKSNEGSPQTSPASTGVEIGIRYRVSLWASLREARDGVVEPLAKLFSNARSLNGS